MSFKQRPVTSTHRTMSKCCFEYHNSNKAVQLASICVKTGWIHNEISTSQHIIRRSCIQNCPFHPDAFIKTCRIDGDYMKCTVKCKRRSTATRCTRKQLGIKGSDTARFIQTHLYRHAGSTRIYGKYGVMQGTLYCHTMHKELARIWTDATVPSFQPLGL